MRFIICFLITLGFLMGPFSATAQTSDLKQLIELFISIGIISPDKADQARNAVSNSLGQSSSGTFCHTFKYYLTVGTADPNEVTALTVVLSKEGFLDGKSDIFDEDVAAAVVQFQGKYGIRQTGTVGPLTRAKLNSLYGCNKFTPSQPSTPNLPQTPAISNSPAIGLVSEQVKCVFDGSQSEQRCHTAADGGSIYNGIGCSGVGTCVTGVKGYKGDSITWKSSCGGYAYTTMGGNNAYAKFSCTQTGTSSSVSAYLAGANDDKVGLWNNFGPGVGNGNKNPADWNWAMNINLPTQKTVSRITVRHNTRGEIWSTGYSRYLKDGTDLYGREEHPYPLVVTRDGNQINNGYDQTILTGTGSYFLKLYGQPESSSFTGGKIIVEFSDGTSVTEAIPASDYRQTATTPLPTTQPSITLSINGQAVSSNGPSEVVAGQPMIFGWTSTNTEMCQADETANGSFPTLWFGNKGVSGSESILIPSDERGPAAIGIMCRKGSVWERKDAFIHIVAPILQLPTTTQPSITFSINGQSSSAGGIQVTAGQSATLAWSSTGADSCQAITDPSVASFPTLWLGNKSTSGTETIIIPADKRGLSVVGIRCSNSALYQSSTLLFSVIAQSLPQVTFSYGGYTSVNPPQSVIPGSSATISWSSTGADSCQAISEMAGSSLQNWIGPKPLSGSENLVLPTNLSSGPLSIGVSCSNSAGHTDARISTTVVSKPTITVTINGQAISSNAGPSQVTAGQPMVFGWTSTGTEMCQANTNTSFPTLWFGNKSTSGTETIVIPVDKRGLAGIGIMCRDSRVWEAANIFINVVAPVSSQGANVFGGFQQWPWQR